MKWKGTRTALTKPKPLETCFEMNFDHMLLPPHTLETFWNLFSHSPISLVSKHADSLTEIHYQLSKL